MLNLSLINDDDFVVVGLSGGADSVALLNLLHIKGIKIVAVHINHNLRDNSNQDEEFCVKICEQLKIPIEVYSLNIKNNEEAGREARYAHFLEVMQRHGANKIATAHHLDDNAETIMFNFLRGSAGLKGIPLKRGVVIRPLLDIKKVDILKYCKENGLTYIEDITNFEPIYTRNKIRLELLPYISENINKSINQVLVRNEKISAIENDYLEAEVDKVFEGESIEVSKFNLLHDAIKCRLIRRMLKDQRNVTYRNIDDVINLTKSENSNKSINLPNNMIAQISYSKLIISKNIQKLPVDVIISMGQTVELNGVCFKLSEEDNKKVCTFILNDDIINVECKLRNRENGDFIALDYGRKKIKDFFIDKKIPRDVRRETIFLASGSEVIVVPDFSLVSSNYKYSGGGIPVYLQVFRDERDKNFNNSTRDTE